MQRYPHSWEPRKRWYFCPFVPIFDAFSACYQTSECELSVLRGFPRASTAPVSTKLRLSKSPTGPAQNQQANAWMPSAPFRLHADRCSHLIYAGPWTDLRSQSALMRTGVLTLILGGAPHTMLCLNPPCCGQVLSPDLVCVRDYRAQVSIRLDADRCSHQERRAGFCRGCCLNPPSCGQVFSPPGPGGPGGPPESQSALMRTGVLTRRDRSQPDQDLVSIRLDADRCFHLTPSILLKLLSDLLPFPNAMLSS